MRRKPIVSVTYENERISIKKKKQPTLLNMCVTSLLCGPPADLWPFSKFALSQGKESHYIFSKFNPLNTDTRLYGQEVNRFSQKAKFANANT